MIDDATSRVLARFVGHDTTEENLRLLWSYLERFGRPVAFYTDKAGLLETASKRVAGEDQRQQPQTQITRALAELGIERISAHSPQAKGRIERFFETAQDRLVKGLRLAGAADRDAANLYLAGTFLPEWEQRFTVAAANATDAHRPLTQLHNLAAALSRVEMRTITSDYTLAYAGQRYQIARSSIRPAMKGHRARVEARLDGTVAVRFEGQYLDISAALVRAPQPSTDGMSPPVRK